MTFCVYIMVTIISVNYILALPFIILTFCPVCGKPLVPVPTLLTYPSLSTSHIEVSEYNTASEARVHVGGTVSGSGGAVQLVK